MKARYKNFYFGEMSLKAYCKTAGLGYEVGILFDGKPVFVGNFVHKTECNNWWKKMCVDLVQFCKKYEFFPYASATWNKQFIGNHVYKTYYKWLDLAFVKHSKTYDKAYAKDLKTYKKYEKNYRNSYHYRAA